MKNLLFILTVLLCTVSCSKEETKIEEFDFNVLLLNHNIYNTISRVVWTFNNGILYKSDNLNGNYEILTKNVLRVNYYQQFPGELKFYTKTFRNCTLKNDTIYYIEDYQTYILMWKK